MPGLKLIHVSKWATGGKIEYNRVMGWNVYVLDYDYSMSTLSWIKTIYLPFWLA